MITYGVQVFNTAENVPHCWKCSTTREVVFAQHCEHVKCHGAAQFKIVDCMLCDLTSRKAKKKKEIPESQLGPPTRGEGHRLPPSVLAGDTPQLTRVQTHMCTVRERSQHRNIQQKHLSSACTVHELSITHPAEWHVASKTDVPAHRTFWKPITWTRQKCQCRERQNTQGGGGLFDFRKTSYHMQR